MQELVQDGNGILRTAQLNQGRSAHAVRVEVFRVYFDEVFRDINGLLPVAGIEQRVGQPAVRRYGHWVIGCGLPQVLGRSAVVLHLEENKAAQMACRLVIGV